MLSLEAERYESQTNQLEGETHSMRRELQLKEQNIRRLQENVELMDKELQQVSARQYALLILTAVFSLVYYHWS